MFNKIYSNNLIGYIFTFLKLSNLKDIYYTCKRFKNILNNDNKKIYKTIFNLTYGFNNIKDFTNNINNYSINSFTFYNYPIILMELYNNNLIISPSIYENGFYVYNLENFKLIKSIKYLDKLGKGTFVYYLKSHKNFLLVSYNNLNLISYNLENNLFDINWEKEIGISKPINNISFYKEYFFTCETDENILTNFIKQFYTKNANHINTYQLLNCSIIKMKIFELKIEEKNDFYLIFSVSYYNPINNKYDFFDYENQNSKISLTNIENEIINKKNNIFEENNFYSLYFNYNLFGHSSKVKNFDYNKQNNFLISVGVDLYIFIWDMNNIKIKFVIDSKHENVINSLCLIDDNFFMTCGKDRKILIYSINNLLEKKDSFVKEILSYHISDINEIFYYKNIIISGSNDKKIKLMYLDNHFNIKNKIILTGHSTQINCCKYDYVNSCLITIGMDLIINIWKFNKNKNFKIVKSIELNINNLSNKEYIDDFIFLYDDLNTLIKIDNSNTIKMFSLVKEQFYHSLNLESNIKSICNIFDGESFLCGLSNGKIQIIYYNINKHKIFKKGNTIIHKESLNLKINKLKLLDYNKKIVGSCANDGSIVIFDIKNNLKKEIKIKNKKEINSIIKLKNKNNKIEICFSIKNKIYVFEYYEEKVNILYSFEIINSVFLEKLNDEIIIFFIKNKNDVFFFNINKETLENNIKLNNNGLSKNIFYLNDGENLFIQKSSKNNQNGFDLIKFYK